MRSFVTKAGLSRLTLIGSELQTLCMLLMIGLLLCISFAVLLSGGSPFFSNGSLAIFSPFMLANLLLVGIFSLHVRHRLHREQRCLYDMVCRMSESSGEDFFSALTRQLSDFLGARYVHIGYFSGSGGERLKTLAVFRDGKVCDNAEYDLSDMPCASIAQGETRFYAKGLQRRYPDSPLVSDLQALSYLGYPLRDATGTVVGVISAFGSKPLRHNKKASLLLSFLARHSSVELERLKVQQAISHMAYQDPLTEMPNWRFFRERLVTTLGQAGQVGNRFGLMFLDVDRFKNVNQAFGHETGDLLLRLFAERLAKTLGEQAILSRKGGDRFFVLLPQVAGAEEMRRVAERLLAMLRAPFAVQGREVYLSISVGIVNYPEDGENIAALLANADAAMHRAKDLGGGRIECYKPAMGAAGRMRLGLEGALRKALEKDELRLHYQPQYELRSERIVGEEGLLQDRISSHLVGAECLVRWVHPGRGLVPPMEFIPLAEEIGLIEEIGAWMLETACSQLQLWQQWFGSDLKMSINLSARQLYDPTLVDRIGGALRVNGLPPQTLCLELTESCLMANVQENQLLLQRLRGLGVGIAIDDFGTGYSSLSYLRRFPVSSLKIDRSFVQDICEHTDHQAIVKNIVAMADTLKLEVVAEGVETEGQLSCLYAAGCRIVQGHMLGRPLGAEDFAVLLNAAGAQAVSWA